MGLIFAERFDNLQDFVHHQVADLYDAEHRFQDTLEKMVEKADDARLKQIFSQQHKACKTRIIRLESVFKGLEMAADRVTCHAAKGIMQETSETLSAKGNPAVLDSALIANAQRAHHYFMAGYGSTRCQLGALDHSRFEADMDGLLGEHKGADEALAELATAVRGVNAAAAR